MDLFTYLMTKKGHNLSTHGDLFSYLLGKNNQLPSEYQRLEYIESTGTQYIDTGYKPNNTTRVTAKAYINSNGWLFGSRASTTSTEQFVLYISTTKGQQRYNYRVGNQEAIAIKTSNIIGKSNFDFSCTNYKVTNDVGTYTGTISNINTFTGQYNMYLLALNLGGTATIPISAKLYSFKIYDNNQLIRNFIPCMRKSDNEVGLYDTVGKQFYTNAGTGKFAYKGYTFVEYIESTGTQYIDTNISSLKNLNAEIDIQGVGLTTSTSIILSKSSGIGRWIGFSSDGYYTAGTDAKTKISATLRKKINVDFLTDSIAFKIDGNMYSRGSSTSAVNNCKYNIFAGENNINGEISYFSKARLYSLLLKENGNLICNLIPTIRNSDNAIGLYDLVNDTFYDNAGTGTFVIPDNVQLNSIQSLNTSLLSSNLQEETNIDDIQEKPNLDDVNEIEEPIEEEVS